MQVERDTMGKTKSNDYHQRKAVTHFINENKNNRVDFVDSHSKEKERMQKFSEQGQREHERFAQTVQAHHTVENYYKKLAIDHKVQKLFGWSLIVIVLLLLVTSHIKG